MKVSNDVLNILGDSEVNGNSLVLPQQLDRKMYVAVNKVLEAAGWKWNKKSKAHTCDGDAVDVLDQVLLTGEVTIAKNEFGFFPTPANIVDMLIELAQLNDSMMVLEPSAGKGAIAIEVDKLCEGLQMYEALPENINILRAHEWKSKFIGVKQVDFLTVLSAPLYDRVIMNPPFSRQQDIDHVTHAMKFLKPGGALVSVMSNSIMFRTDKKTKAFHQLLANHDGEIHKLPDGSFKASGTMVNTVIVRMIK